MALKLIGEIFNFIQSCTRPREAKYIWSCNNYEGGNKKILKKLPTTKTESYSNDFNKMTNFRVRHWR